MRLPLTAPRHCQFPRWGDDRPTHRYCGDPAQPGSAYCPAHHARCHAPRPPPDAACAELEPGRAA